MAEGGESSRLRHHPDGKVESQVGLDTIQMGLIISPAAVAQVVKFPSDTQG